MRSSVTYRTNDGTNKLVDVLHFDTIGAARRFARNTFNSVDGTYMTAEKGLVDKAVAIGWGDLIKRGCGMMTLSNAKKWAKTLEGYHGEPYLVFKTPSGAPCNQYPGNVFNRGQYAVCKASEKAVYEQGGAEFGA